MLLPLFLLAAAASVRAENIHEYIQREANFSEFAKLQKEDEFASLVHKTRPCTVFAPTDEAFKLWNAVNRGADKSNIVEYHTLNSAVSKSQFPTTMASMLSYSAPLFMGRGAIRYDSRNSPRGEAFFVNDGMVVKERKLRSTKNEVQILYTVDRVNRPFAKSDGQKAIPTALELINNVNFYKNFPGQGGFDMGTFGSRIRGDPKLSALFSAEGDNTFFVPKSVASSLRNKVDEAIIRGHVISGRTMYLRAMSNGTFKSAAYDDKVKVELQMMERQMNSGLVYFIKSNTLSSNNPQHHKGIAVAKVIKGNVPVTNGVVHFIEKPVMLVDMSIKDFISKVEKSGQLNEFEAKLSMFPRIRHEVDGSSQKTIFAPTNEAFKRIESHLRESKNYTHELEQIMRLHVVMRKTITSDKALNATQDKDDTLNKGTLTLDGKTRLYYNAWQKGDRRVLTVDGGGVNATAIQADIGATNGIIHIIDQVLGIPFMTIAEKMRTDPLMETTWRVGRHGGDWSSRLQNTNRKFTVFVPSEMAWFNMSLRMPSEHKQLIQGHYPDLADKILDRHLLLNRALSADDLRNTSNREIKTVRGVIRVKNANPLMLEWEGIVAEVTKENVPAVNGVIHVIDKVFMMKRDLAVGGGHLLQPSMSTTLTTIALLLSSWLLLH